MSLLKFRSKTKGCPNWGLRQMEMWDCMFLSEKLSRHQSCSEPEADGGNQLSQVLNSAFWVTVTFVSGSLADQWLTRRQLLPRRPRELGRVCRMLHWSGSELWFPRFLPPSASPSVRSASEPTRRRHAWTASVPPPPRSRVISCKFACIWWIPGYFKWVKENPQLRSLVISESHCEYVINVLPRQFPRVGNGPLYFQQASS